VTHLPHPAIFTLDALPVATLPIYPGLGQAPSMLDCIPSGLVELLKQWNNNSDETARHASLLTV